MSSGTHYLRKHLEPIVQSLKNEGVLKSKELTRNSVLYYLSQSYREEKQKLTFTPQVFQDKFKQLLQLEKDELLVDHDLFEIE